MSTQCQDARKKACQNGPYGHEKTSDYGEVPDRRKIDEEARIGRETAQEPGDEHQAQWIAWVMVSQVVSQKVSSDIDTDRVDREQHPWNLMGPIRW